MSNWKASKKRSGACMKQMANYDTLRPFLRFISYGCYTKTNYPKSSHTYENNLARLRQFLPAERLVDTPHGNNSPIRLKGDAFIDSDNFLMDTFRARRMTKYDLFYKFHLLRILNTAQTPLLPAELLRKLETETITTFNCPQENISEKAILPDINTMRRHLDDLVDIGMVVTLPQGKRTAYSLATNPLAGLSPDEQDELYAAVAFHKNNTLLSVPGYYLETTLSRMRPSNSAHLKLYQFKNLNFTRIIDDEIVHQIIYAIEQNHLISFTYTQAQKGQTSRKIPSARPEAIITDYLTGSRQYLIAYIPKQAGNHHRYPQRQTFRLENISNLKLEQMVQLATIKSPHPKGIPLNFRIRFFSQEERKRLMFRVTERFPHVTFKEEGLSSILCTVLCSDHLQYAPWFRTLYPNVELLHTPRSHLCQYLENTRKETLNNYGEQI